jgi:hypothetical protein
VRPQSQKIAQVSLDFAGEESVCSGVNTESAMDAAIADPAIKTYLTEIRQRLDEAARIARAADACAQAGSPDEAVTCRSWSAGPSPGVAERHQAQGHRSHSLMIETPHAARLVRS